MKEKRFNILWGSPGLLLALEFRTSFTEPRAIVQRLLGAPCSLNLGAPKVRRTEQTCAERSLDQGSLGPSWSMSANKPAGETIQEHCRCVSYFPWSLGISFCARRFNASLASSVCNDPAAP